MEAAERREAEARGEAPEAAGGVKLGETTSGASATSSAAAAFSLTFWTFGFQKGLQDGHSKARNFSNFGNDSCRSNVDIALRLFERHNQTLESLERLNCWTLLLWLVQGVDRNTATNLIPIYNPQPLYNLFPFDPYSTTFKKTSIIMHFDPFALPWLAAALHSSATLTVNTSQRRPWLTGSPKCTSAVGSSPLGAIDEPIYRPGD